MNGGTMLAFDATDQNGNLSNECTSAGNHHHKYGPCIFQNLSLYQGHRATILASLNNLSGAAALAPGFGTFQALNIGGGVTLGSNSTLSIDLGSLPGCRTTC